MTLTGAFHHIHNVAIIFDTNAIFNKCEDKFALECRVASDFYKFIQYRETKKLNLANLFVSKMTLNEIIKQRKELYVTKKKDFNDICRYFNIDHTINDEIIDKIPEDTESFFTNNGIRILEYPNNLNKIIERAIEKKTPFKGGKPNSDAGFKDVIIWESILTYNFEAERTGKIIFFSNDNGFKKDLLTEEFKQIYPRISIEFIKDWDVLKKEISDLHLELIASSNINYDLLLEKFKDNDSEIIQIINPRKTTTKVDTNVVKIIATLKKQDGTEFDAAYFYDASVNEIELEYLEPEEISEDIIDE